MIVKDIEVQKQNLREVRNNLCFPVINRGRLWYDRLTNEQLGELETWYQDWLDAPETLKIPLTPSWLNQKTIKGEEIL